MSGLGQTTFQLAIQNCKPYFSYAPSCQAATILFFNNLLSLMDVRIFLSQVMSMKQFKIS